MFVCEIEEKHFNYQFFVVYYFSAQLFRFFSINVLQQANPAKENFSCQFCQLICVAFLHRRLQVPQRTVLLLI
jgi:hypothetical protein